MYWFVYIKSFFFTVPKCFRGSVCNFCASDFLKLKTKTKTKLKSFENLVLKLNWRVGSKIKTKLKDKRAYEVNQIFQFSTFFFYIP